MEKTIGQIIAKIAKGQGLTQAQFGAKINLTKQGVASIYKRASIDVALLAKISSALDYDFFKHIYDKEPMLSFKLKEQNEWHRKFDTLNSAISLKEELLSQRQELVETQRKLILELEKKVKGIQGT